MKRITIMLMALLLGTFLWSQLPPDHYELIIWDFEETLEPEYVDFYIIDASDITPDTSTVIDFMEGRDGGNRWIGFSAEPDWTTDGNFNPNDPPEKYIQFSFRPYWNYAAHLGRIEFRFGRNETGPRAIVGQFSLDNFQERISDPFWIANPIESEDPDNLQPFFIDFQGAGLRYRTEDEHFTLRMWPIYSVDTLDLDGYTDDPEELVFWDFQNRVSPAYVDEHIRAGNISISEGSIEFMPGTDGNNSHIGYSQDDDWSTEVEYRRNNPPEKYLQYTLRPDGDETIHLDSFEFRFGRNEVGPRAVVVEMFFNGNYLLTNPILLQPNITSEDPNSLNGYDIINLPIRFRGRQNEFMVRMFPIGAIDDPNVNDDPMLMMNNFRVNGYIVPTPTLMMNNFVVNGFIIPFPSFTFLLDRSGSMGDENFGLGYWDGARQRIQLFTAQVINDLDAMCLVTFNVEDMESDDYEDHTEVIIPMRWPSNKISQIWHEPTTPDSVVTRNFIIEEIDDLEDPIGRTSIGSGLLVALEEIEDIYGRKPGKAAIVLLSDGFDNWPPFARDVIPDDVPDSVDVYTIALGTVADVNLLRWIARETGGEYALANNVDQLTAIYYHIYFKGHEQLQNHYSTQGTIAANDRFVHDIIVDDKTGQMKFFLATDSEDTQRQTVPVSFTLISPSGTVISPEAIQRNAGIKYSESFAGKHYDIIMPEAGVWQAVVQGNNIPEEMLYYVFAYGQSSIWLDFETIEDEYTINNPLTFTATLKDGNEPIRGASVTAMVTVPEEDARNRNYSNVQGTPFADFEPENTFNTLIESNRNPDPIEVVLTETEPGVYNGALTQTELAGGYNISVHATLDNQDYHFNRQTIYSAIVQPPERLPVPRLAYPADGSLEETQPVQFVWSNIWEADSYHFQLATTAEIIYNIEGLENNSIIIDSLDFETQYSWRVKAVRGEEDSYWSTIWNFRTGAPEIPAPLNLQGTVRNEGVYLYWEGAPSEHHYYGDLFGYLVYRDEQLHALVNPGQTNHIDRHAIPGNTYSYYIKSAYGLTGQWVSEPSNVIQTTMTGIEIDDIPSATKITGNYPNPFNPETTISFALKTGGNTRITVYNIAGQRVRTLVNDVFEPGYHSVVWNSLDDRNNQVTSGIYFIKMETDSYTGHRKVLLLK